MSRTTAARARTLGTPRPIAVCLVVITVMVVATLLHQAGPPAAPAFSEPADGQRGGPTTEVDGAITEEDGVLPDGVTPFDDEHPGVANMDPELLQAIRAAATDAADDGVQVYVNSGWRSPEYQEHLRREAVAEHGSAEAAARWVASPDASAHLSGNAIDIGHVDARAWLSEHGAGYGLCQTYLNEPWHFELRPDAVHHGCPAMYADTTQDPRMDHDLRRPPVPPPSR